MDEKISVLQSHASKDFILRSDEVSSQSWHPAPKMSLLRFNNSHTTASTKSGSTE